MYLHVPQRPAIPARSQAGTSAANRGAAADETSLALTHAGGGEPAPGFQPADRPLMRARSTGRRCRRPYARRTVVHIWNVEPQELRDACPVAWTRLRPLTGGSRWTRRRRSSESCRRSAGVSVERPLHPLRPQAGPGSPTASTPRRQRLLRSCAGCTLPSGSRLIHPLLAHRSAGQQRARHGDLIPQARRRRDPPLSDSESTRSTGVAARVSTAHAADQRGALDGS